MVQEPEEVVELLGKLVEANGYDGLVRAASGFLSCKSSQRHALVCLFPSTQQGTLPRFMPTADAAPAWPAMRWCRCWRCGRLGWG